MTFIQSLRNIFRKELPQKETPLIATDIFLYKKENTIGTFVWAQADAIEGGGYRIRNELSLVWPEKKVSKRDGQVFYRNGQVFSFDDAVEILASLQKTYENDRDFEICLEQPLLQNRYSHYQKSIEELNNEFV